MLSAEMVRFGQGKKARKTNIRVFNEAMQAKKVQPFESWIGEVDP